MVLTRVVDVFVHCIVNLFQATPQCLPPMPQVEQTMMATTTTPVEPQTAAPVPPEKFLPSFLSEKTTEQQQPQQQSQQQQQQQDVEDNHAKVANVDANRKSETDIVFLCVSEPGRFIKRKETDPKTANESQDCLNPEPETQPGSRNAESPASLVSSFSHHSDSNSSATGLSNSNLKVKNIVSSQPTVMLQPLNLGGRASIRLQSLEERLKEGSKTTVPSDSVLNRPKNQTSVNSTKPQGERKRHRSASDIEASGQVFLTASPRKRPKECTSSEPVQSHSETNKNDRGCLPLTVTDPQGTEGKGASPKERPRSVGSENGSNSNHDSNFSGSPSKGKYKSSKGKSKQRYADLEAHSPEKPGLKLLIRSKSTSTKSEFTSSVVDPYKFDDSEEGGSHFGESRSQKRKTSDDNDSESDGSHGSGDHAKKQEQSSTKPKLQR